MLVTPEVGRAEAEGLVLTDGRPPEAEPEAVPQVVLRPAERHCCDPR